MARSFAQFGRLPEGPAADVDMGELVAYTARATVPERIALDLDIQATQCVRGHHDSLARALSNVLLNAVEASGDGGRIAVRVRDVTHNGEAAVRVAVQDSGAGIPADRLESIWSPYVTHKAGGTGLGLAIARQAVEAHGGTVFARSGAGTTEVGFTVPVNSNLPVITAEHRATQ
jgi:signal transduction histidine kinase